MIDPMSDPTPYQEEPIITCECGCDEWLAIEVSDYPIVVCWQCKNCGKDM